MALLTKEFAAARPDELALADEHTSRTWAELDERVNRLLSSFRSAGLEPGDTVAVVAGNCTEWFETTLACAHGGMLYVPVNWHWVADEIAYVLGDSGAKAIVSGRRFISEVDQALDHPDAGAVTLAVAVTDDSPAPDRFEDFEALVAAGDPAEPADQAMGGPMFYTSGTTGHPKGVRSSLSASGPDTSPEFLQLVAGSFSQYLPVPGRTLLCGPIYHSAQWAFSWLPLLAGSSVVMQHKYDSAGVLELIDRHRVTNLHLVPTQMRRLLDLPDATRDAFDGSSLEVVLHGAAPCPPAVKRQMIDWWGPIITEYYGSTEGAIISTISAEEWLERGGSVGKPTEVVEVIVVGEDGERRAANEEGTLYFRNLLGTDFEYHNAPDKTAEAHLEPGVFTTGDIGYLDDDGYLWLSDRRIDMIISGGVNIYPAEIEGVIAGHEAALDAAVIGVPNEEFGEEVKAVVVAADPDADRDQLTRVLLAHCREHLAGYKCPRSIDYVDELPHTGTGKVQKRHLREPYWAGHDRKI